MKKVVFISGVSKGIGFATAQHLAKLGYIVYGGARTPIDEENIHYVPLDVTNSESVNTALSTIIQKEGRLDVLINNAGMGISGAVEQTSLKSAKYNFEVNFFGSYQMIQFALPYLRSTRGKIINISSLASIIPIPYQAFYCASKAALDSFSLSLQIEVKPFGIKVTNVLPGDTKTTFTEHREKEFNELDQIYANRIQKSINKMEKDEQNGMSPLAVAKVIARVIKRKNPPLKVAVGLKNKVFVLLFKILPSKLALSILNKMYNE